MSFRTVLTSALVLALAPCALAQTNYPESEPNENKAQANAVTLAPSDSFSGVSGSSSAPDFFLVKTTPLTLGIYRHQLRLTRNPNSGSSFSQAMMGLPQTNGVIGTTETAILNTTTSTPESGIAWYGFGKEERFYYRVQGGSAGITYTCTLFTVPVTPTVVSGAVRPGPVTLSVVDPTFASVGNPDIWLYDANLNAIPDAGNNDIAITGCASKSSRLTRTLAPGTYYLGVASTNLASNLPSPADDANRSNNVLDFPDVAFGQATFGTGNQFQLRIADADGSTADALEVFSGTTGFGNWMVWLQFTVTNPPSGVAFGSGGATVVSDATGNGNSNSAADPGETSIGLTIPVTNLGADTATGVSATLVSLTPTAVVVTAGAAYPSIAYNTPASNSAPFIIALSPSHPCGAAVNLRLNVSSDQGSGTFDFKIAAGSPGTPITTSWAGSVAIPDNNPVGASQTMTIAGVGPLHDLNLRFDGTTCNSMTGSTTVGVAHQRVQELVVTLTSPHSTSAVLMNNPGPTGFTSSTNICQAVLDDEATTPARCMDSGIGAITGSYTPESPLSAFDLEDANGDWTLKIVDNVATTSGTLQFFSLIATPYVCAAPSVAAGSCCETNGSCAFNTLADCTTGTWTGGGFCNPNPCPQPATGACCNGTTCSIATSAACTGGSGAYKGDNTTCDFPSNPVTCCPANYDQINGLQTADIFSFLNGWFSGNINTDFDNSGGLTTGDVFAFLNAWFAGCH